MHDALLDRVRRAYVVARDALLAERTPAGHWEGRLSSSALSTATATSALALLYPHQDAATRAADERRMTAGLDWVFAGQNDDGGWGDTDRSLSNVATTMLVLAATALAERALGGERSVPRAEAVARAERYLAERGGIAGLRRRYGVDKTFAVPILTNAALAGQVDWAEVDPLPFEWACLPQAWYRFVGLPVVSYAIPALVAIGQARLHHRPPWFAPLAWLRRAAIEPSLRVLERMQPASGGYLEATPLTSFVVMSLAGCGRHAHPVARRGAEFLRASGRPDGSWPIDTNLATWVTTLAVNALAPRETAHLTPPLIDWLLECQHRRPHPFTGAEPGGWGWTDLSGAVPDSDDTPGAVLALGQCLQAAGLPREVAGRVLVPMAHGCQWLARLQNLDGGWPTFCRGWGKLPFDRSGTDLTAHALRALAGASALAGPARIGGLAFLRRRQRADGAWVPLWFGNQHDPDEENAVYGTARVLLAYRDLRLMEQEPARWGVEFLIQAQNPDGGWGGGPAHRVAAGRPVAAGSSVEETAVAVEALLAAADYHDAVRSAAWRGLEWLVAAVESGRFREPSPIGFYFAKLWYYEQLYPIIFTVSALGRALDREEGTGVATTQEQTQPPSPTLPDR